MDKQMETKRTEGGREKMKMNEKMEGMEREEIAEERKMAGKKAEIARKGGTKKNLIMFTDYCKVAYKCNWDGKTTAHKLTADRIIHSQSAGR